MTSKEIIDEWRKIILYYNPLNNEDIEEGKKQITKDLDRLEKLEKFVKSINKLLNFRINEYKGNYTLEHTRNSIVCFDINKELADLVKEVLENE